MTVRGTGDDGTSRHKARRLLPAKIGGVIAMHRAGQILRASMTQFGSLIPLVRSRVGNEVAKRVSADLAIHRVPLRKILLFTDKGAPIGSKYEMVCDNTRRELWRSQLHSDVVPANGRKAIRPNVWLPCALNNQ